MRYFLSFSLCIVGFATSSAYAADVTTTKTLKRGTEITANDISIALSPGENEGDILQDYLGKFVLRTLYKGSNIHPRDVSDPIVIKRNTNVTLYYKVNGLQIKAKGRALSEASAGDPVTVINSSSRNRIEGVATAAGIVEVQP